MPKFLDVTSKSTARDYLDVPSRVQQGTAARLFLVLDDQFVSHNTAIAEAEKRGQRLNLALSCNWVNGQVEIRNEHMRWPDIRAAALRGHGIMSHSMSHNWMTTRTTEQLVDEFETSKALIESKIGREINTFVYPSSKQDPTTNSAGYLRYKRLFAGDFEGLVWRHKFWKRHPFVHGRYDWGSSNHSTVLAEVTAAAAADEDIVIYTHATDGSDYLTEGNTLAELQEMLDLALRLGMRVVSIDEMGYDDFLVDPGFEDSDNFADNFDVTVTSWGENATAEIVTLATAEGLPGSKVLKLSNTQDTTGSIVVTQKTLIPTTVFNVESPFEVFVSGRIKCDRDTGAGGAQFRLVLADVDGTLGTGAGGTAQSTTSYSTNEWSDVGELYNATGLLMDKEAWPYFTIQYRITNMTGDAWFDHAQIGQTLYEIGVAGS